MKNILFLSLFLLSTLGFSQGEKVEVQAEVFDSVYFQSKSFITLEIVSMLSNDLPRYRLGYIQVLNEKWAIGLDIGYGNENISLGYDDERTEDYKLFEIRSELYYLLNADKKLQHYVSAEIFYIYHNATLLNSRYEAEENGQTILYTSADYYRQKYGLNIKYGLFIHFGKNFGLNPYVGIGLRNRVNEYSNVQNPESGGGGFDALFDLRKGLDYRRKEGLVGGPNFDIGLKIYYRF